MHDEIQSSWGLLGGSDGLIYPTSMSQARRDWPWAHPSPAWAQSKGWYFVRFTVSIQMSTSWSPQPDILAKHAWFQLVMDDSSKWFVSHNRRVILEIFLPSVTNLYEALLEGLNKDPHTLWPFFLDQQSHFLYAKFAEELVLTTHLNVNGYYF